MSARRDIFFVLAVALSLSIGWGIRGNFGHETGAMIPGALAALAAVALAGRPDWLGKAGSFAFFGALGWSFGGSISYMQVIAYTHSGHSLSIFYGFACLFWIGFLWAIFGGVGTALPAVLTRERLVALYPLVLVIFISWVVQDWAVEHFIHVDSAFRQRDPLYWYDTDWLGITVALAATLLYAAARRRIDFGVRLSLWLCGGWWAGFVLFVLVLGWRMTPPRGDNWAGCSGMAVALVIFLARERLPQLLEAGIISGVIGGIGFAGADCLKLLGIGTGWQTNWHSLLEQSYGFINGLGIAAIMLRLQKHALPADPAGFEPSARERQAERLAAAFVLVGVTYLNLWKNVETWTKAGALPTGMYGLSAGAWFDIAYLGTGVLILAIVFSPSQTPLRTASPLAKTLALYLVFLWWMVTGNFERALVHFAPQRLVTEGVILLNALLCSGLLLLQAPSTIPPYATFAALRLRKLIPAAIITGAATAMICWGVIRMTFGNSQVAYASRHIRFGPDATANTVKPAPDQPHP